MQPYVIKVPLGVRSYTISIGSNLLSRLGHECKRLYLGQRCAVITDRNVAPHYGQAAVENLEAAGFEPTLLPVPAGETAKSLKVVASCYDQLAEKRLERKSFVVALGGGVVGDLAGFVAATFLRGIDFVQIPTTLLAQVDSSVGGKVGVNLKTGKNLVGAFYQPRFVLCDLETLGTLPVREYRQVLAAKLSAELLGLPQRDVERVAVLFEKAGLPTHIKLNPAQREKVLEAMQHDKKVSEGIVKFVLVNKIGQVSFGQAVPLDLVEKVLAEPPIQTAGSEPSAGADALQATLRTPHRAF